LRLIVVDGPKVVHSDCRPNEEDGERARTNRWKDACGNRETAEDQQAAARQH